MQALFYKKVNRAVSPVTRTKKTGDVPLSPGKKTGDVPFTRKKTDRGHSPVCFVNLSISGCFVSCRTLHDDDRDHHDAAHDHAEAGDQVAPVTAQRGDDRGFLKVVLPDEQERDRNNGADWQVGVALRELVGDGMPL